MKEEPKNNDPEKLIFRKALDDLKIEPSEKFWNAAFFAIDNKGNSAVHETALPEKEDFVNSDPEKLIFKRTLDNHRIEPSEKFWNTALHNIINKESTLRIKQVRTWKLISAGLAVVIAAFCVQEAMLYNKMDKIEQQVSELKKAQNQTSVNTGSTATNESHSNIISQQIASTSNVPKVKDGLQTGKDVSAVDKDVRPKQNPVNNIILHSARGAERSNLSGKIATIRNNIAINHSNTKQNTIVNSDMHVNSGNTLITKKALENINTENPETQTALQNNNADSISNNTYTISNQNGQVVAQAKDVKQDSSVAATNSAEALPPIEGEKKANGFLHKLSVSAFITPGFLISKLYDNNTDDEIHPNDISDRESGNLAWQTGFKIGLDMGKFTLYTGLYYYGYSDYIKQTDITARELDNGTVGYSVITSSGVVDIPSSATSSSTGGTTHRGDSMKIYGSTARAYACIPLQLSFSIAIYKKIGFFAQAGITFNIASYSYTCLSWQDANMDEGNVTLNSVDGLRKLQLGYNIGVGASYALSKHFLFYLEPIVRASITSVSKDAPVSNYPLFLGSSVGLTYHF